MVKEYGLDSLLSVVVSVYNVEKYLRRCLDSIINQTYRNLEIILIDDGSTDSSGRICDEYLNLDERIVVIHKRNGGLVSARKRGVEAATGKYIAHIDSDDWIERDMYAKLIKKIEENNADLVTSGVYRDYGKHRVRECDYVPEGVYCKKEIHDLVYPCSMYTGKFYQAGINMHIYNKIYKSELIKKKQMIIDDNICVGEDAALVYPCVFAANKIVVSHDCYYHYCIRDESIMGTSIVQEHERIQLLYMHLKKEIELSDMSDILLRQLDYLITYAGLLKIPQKFIKVNKENIIEPFDKLLVGSKVVLYGAGKFGKAFYKFNNDARFCEIVLWVDKIENSDNKICKVDCIDDIDKCTYDYIVIGVLAESAVVEITDELCGRGIDRDKIVKIDVTKLENGIF